MARYPTIKTGLVLTGGGARAAYQVGVMRAVAELLPRGWANPFPIICGTSAGAINAAALAANADNFRKAVRDLLVVWRNFEVGHVYRADALGIAKTGAVWLLAMLLGGLGKNNPTSLLDNAPLRELLERYVQFDRIAENVVNHHLYALSINATGYTSGQSVAFFQADPGAQPWKRARRVGVPSEITLDHLMASSAIPFIFPAVRIHREFFGDGSMRQLAPISPALHLGADRVLVIAVGRLTKEQPERQVTTHYPSLAQIAGHALSSIFLDSLEVDLERLQRINRTVSIMPPELREQHGIGLRPVEVLVISPSTDIEVIANRCAKNLPRSLRMLLGGIGATRRTGSVLLSYLLFDRTFCRALIKMGYHDAMAKREELAAFITGTVMRPTV